MSSVLLRPIPLLVLCGLLCALGCTTDDDDGPPVTPPGGGTDVECSSDLGCAFSTGEEICEAGVCVEGDRNNGPGGAQLVEYNSTVALPLSPAGDVDWFRFYGDQGDLILISTEAEDSEALDTVVTYYDAHGNEIALNDDFSRVSSIAPNSRLYSGVAGAGVHYFSVQDKRTWVNDPTDPPSGGANHRYEVTLVQVGEESVVTVAVEEDSPDEPTEWTLEDAQTNYTCGGFLAPRGDRDYFAVNVEAGEALRLYGFPGSGSEGTIEVEAWLEDGTTSLGTWQDLAWDTAHRAWIPVLETGTYLVEVREATGRGGFDYWYYLHAAKDSVDEGLPVETEPNDGADSAEATVVGTDSRWGRLHPVGDQDWYAIEAQDGDQFSAVLSRTEHNESTEVLLQLLSPTGAVAVESTWSGEETPAISQETLTAGTWHLVLSDADPEAGSAGNRFYAAELILLRL